MLKKVVKGLAQGRSLVSHRLQLGRAQRDHCCVLLGHAGLRVAA